MVEKEHIISGIIGGITSLSIAAIACKFGRRDKKTVVNVSEIAKVITMTSSGIPNPIGPFTPGKLIMYGDSKLAFTSGALGLDPKTGDLVSDDVELQAKRAIQNMQNLI